MRLRCSAFPKWWSIWMRLRWSAFPKWGSTRKIILFQVVSVVVFSLYIKSSQDQTSVFNVICNYYALWLWSFMSEVRKSAILSKYYFRYKTCWQFPGVSLLTASGILGVSPVGYPIGIYLFKDKNRNTRTLCGICSKLAIKTTERPHWRCSGVFIVKFNKHILHIVQDRSNRQIPTIKTVKTPLVIVPVGLLFTWN